MFAKKSELSVDDRARIIALYNDSVPKNSMRKIAALTGYGVSTVFRTIDRFRKTNSLQNLPRSGRPSSLTESDRRFLKLCSLRNRRKTLAILTEDLKFGRKIPVSKSVVNRCLHSWGLIGRVACRKPLLSARNVKKRLRFAKEHVKWSRKKWTKVL